MDFSVFENYEVEGQISFFGGKEEGEAQKTTEQTNTADFPEVMP